MAAATQEIRLQNDGADPLVLTPGGWRPKSKVHIVPAGHHVSGAGGRLRIIDTVSGEVALDLGEVPKHKPGPRIRQTKRTMLKNAPSPPMDSWIVDSAWSNTTGSPISYFSSTWTVPTEPATDNQQLIYLFNGLQQTATDPCILQPVLQWGASPDGGGNSWAITNWYVGGSGDDALRMEALISVSPGDVLQGIMTLTGQNGTGFSYLSSFRSPAGTDYSPADLPVANVEELAWACETLECYGLTAFTDYPDAVDTAFVDIDIQVRTPAGDTHATMIWTPEDRVTDNGQHCNVVSNACPGGEVDLYYKAGP